MNPAKLLLSKLNDVKPNGKGWQSRCPAHDDRHPSLSIAEGDDGRALVNCHAGCTPQAVVEALGLSMADLMPTANGSGKSKRQIVAQYDYRDESGNVIFQAVRYEPKDFRQRRPMPGDSWDWSVKGSRVVPYHLPEMLADPGKPVVVVEGEKDCDNLHRIGVLSTCNAGGAGKWTAEHAAFLEGRRVIVLPDNDDAGRSHAQRVARSLHGIAKSVRIVALPDLPVKGDVSDWIADGGEKAELDRLAKDSPVWTPEDKPAVSAPRHAPHLICMSGVEPADIRWLWPGRIPLGRLTLLVGRPGDGKSFLMAHLAANVSRGRNWFDGSSCPHGSVVLCSAEDDPADTIAPRLIAHDADRERIHLLAGVMSREDNGEEVERVFTLADLPALRQTLEQLADCKLIVVDPIGSYLGGRTDAHRDNEVRAVLAPVCHLASDYGAAVVVVAHTRKAVAANADDMAMGSRAFTGLARSVLHLMIDPEDESKRRRLLLPGKNNLAERPPGLAFEIGPGGIEDRPFVRWHDGEVTISADEAVNREPQHDDEKRTERDQAADWLRRTLADGPMLATEMRELAKESEGISSRTLDRAKKIVEVKAYRPKNPGPWWWRLRNNGADRHTTEEVASGDVAFCPDDSVSRDFDAPSGCTSPERQSVDAGRPEFLDSVADRDARDERLAICTIDGGLSEDAAAQVAREELAQHSSLLGMQ